MSSDSKVISISNDLSAQIMMVKLHKSRTAPGSIRMVELLIVLRRIIPGDPNPLMTSQFPQKNNYQMNPECFLFLNDRIVLIIYLITVFAFVR